MADLVRILFAAVACGLIWAGFANLVLLRGTWLWEFRYLVLGCAGFGLLTAAERCTAIALRRIRPLGERSSDGQSGDR